MNRETSDAGLNGTDAIERRPSAGSIRDRQGSREPLVDLHFKVPRAFRRRFRHFAADADIRNVELLKRAVECYERDQRKSTDAVQS